MKAIFFNIIFCYPLRIRQPIICEEITIYIFEYRMILRCAEALVPLASIFPPISGKDEPFSSIFEHLDGIGESSAHEILLILTAKRHQSAFKPIVVRENFYCFLHIVYFMYMWSWFVWHVTFDILQKVG